MKEGRESKRGEKEVRNGQFLLFGRGEKELRETKYQWDPLVLFFSSK
jgi:hypothetical protein